MSSTSSANNAVRIGVDIVRGGVHTVLVTTTPTTGLQVGERSATMAALLPIGTVLPQGTITDYSDTAYRVATPTGDAFVAYVRVHPLQAATPLVTFG